MLRLAYDRPPETPAERVLRIIKERCSDLTDSLVEDLVAYKGDCRCVSVKAMGESLRKY